MAKLKFHTWAALAVLIVSGIWVATGEFSSVGSALTKGENKDHASSQPAPTSAAAVAATDPAATAPAAAEVKPALRTVAYIKPVFIDHYRTIRVSGITQADKRVTLAARSSGLIGDLKIHQGDRIKENAVVLKLDAEDKAAMVKTAKAVLDQRQTEYDATSLLVKRGTTPRLQADNAMSALMTAKSQLEQAQAEINRLELKAPFSGVIDKVEVEKGSYIQAGAPIAVLLALDPIIAKGEVGERDLAHLTLGAAADIQLISGQSAKGTVRHIAREASAQTRTFPVEVAIANPDGKIPAGMTAELILRGEQARAVQLPRSVVTLSGDGELGIRILKADDTVDFVAIDVIDDTWRGLMLAGVPDGARIIVAGQDLVAKGDKVTAVEVDAATVAKFATQTQGAVQ
jgi:membrane fusion protein, multidrug efflux system